MAQTNQKQCPPDQALNAWGLSHSRSLSHPTFLANNCLPPLSPLSPGESNLNTISVDETVPALISPRENSFCGLPPVRGHRRSNSDVPLGFSAMIQSSPQLVPISSHENLGGMVRLGNDKLVGGKKRGVEAISYGKTYVETTGELKMKGEDADGLFDSFISNRVDGKDKDDVNSFMKMSCGDNFNSESEAVSRHRETIRSTGGDESLQCKHSRSLSMDSGIENSSNWPDLLSLSNSLNKVSSGTKMEFGHGEFNEVELQRIMADERLAEVAISDPKRAKRILANRQSAARSKERKLRYIFELEHKVQTLQSEATTLSAQITVLQKDHTKLTLQNNELKFQIQAMQQQAQLRDALHETLRAEIQRLKLGNMVLKDVEHHAS